jgi:hypothetical protein|uniref:hypothetical protein n=1 Tax=Polynucleobacter sp. TaxID=2029855 RepID=UPI004048B676
MKKLFPPLCALTLLLMFFSAYILKLKQFDLLLLLVFGVGLAVYDFYLSYKDGKEDH